MWVKGISGNPAGRSPLPPEKKTAVGIRVKFTRTQKATLEAKAKAAGMTQSAWLKRELGE
jgi:hypothetical protein